MRHHHHGHVLSPIWRSGRAAVFAVLLALVLGGLAVVAHDTGSGTAVDHSVLMWMVGHRQRWVTALAMVVTDAGSPVAMTLLAFLAAGLLWWRLSSPRSGFVVIATLAAAAATSTLTKVVVGAHRPPQAVQLIVEVDPSFPSGHVTGTMALLGMVAVVIGRNRGTATRVALVCVVTTVTFLIAVTRLYLGVHWLTDVVGGALLGGVAVVLGTSCLAAVSPSDEGPGGHRAKSPAPMATRVA